MDFPTEAATLPGSSAELSKEYSHFQPFLPAGSHAARPTVALPAHASHGSLGVVYLMREVPKGH